MLVHGIVPAVCWYTVVLYAAMLRSKGHEAKKRFGEDWQGEAYAYVEECKKIKQEAEDRWRTEWTFHNSGNWTRRLISDPLTFVRRRREINYYVMQILTGYGIFNHYLHRIRKESHTNCWDSGEDSDDAEHVLFKCARWISLETDLGIEWSMDTNIVARLTAEDRLWQKFSDLCTRTMNARQRKEKEIGTRGGRPGRRSERRRRETGTEEIE